MNKNKGGEDNDNEMVVFNRKLFNLGSLEDGLILNFSISNNDINLWNLKNFYLYIYYPYIIIDLARYYQSKYIIASDEYDPWFTNPYFTSENLESVFTQI